MNKDSKIYIAGHNGLVGSAIYKTLKEKGYQNIITRDHTKLDLTNQKDTAAFFQKEKPEYVILAAAKVGGIMANTSYRAEFIYDNIMIQNNVIHKSYVHGVKKLLFLGSSCIYPKNALQPIKEEYLLTSDLEYSNEPYAIAKIAGIKMCESYNLQYGTNYIAVMPTNLYGPHDNYDLNKSHVLPALIRKMHLGKLLSQGNFSEIINDLKEKPISGLSEIPSNEKSILSILNNFGIVKNEENKVEITLWGSGSPFREFLHSEDMAKACVYLMENINFLDLIKDQESDEIKNTHINIGTGTDLSIKDLALLIKNIVGYEGKLNWDLSKPDGTHQKLLNVKKINKLGWKPYFTLEHGIRETYKLYQKNL